MKDGQGGLKEEGALGGWWRTQPLTLAAGRGKAAGPGKTHLPGYHVLSLGSTWSERMERDFETVTSGKQIHIFDKRPDNWALTAHHLQVGSSTRRQARRLKLFSGKQSSHYVPGTATLLCVMVRKGSRGKDTYQMILLHHSPLSPRPRNSSCSSRQSFIVSDSSCVSKFGI